MLELFANPAYLVAGGALVSSPIIIHLINRMRYKRLRWAAMEFLLKAQKRSRRRLIIEQLILLLLRCLLVALAALLVLRFFGLGLGNLLVGQKDHMHIVVLNDDLSMNDQHRDNEGVRTCFNVAKKEVVQEGILKNISQSTTNDRLAVIQLSRVVTDPKYQPKVHDRLNDPVKLKTALDEVEAIQGTKVHADLLRGVEKAQKLAEEHRDKQVTIHVVSDFRKHDWTGLDARPLQEALLKLAKSKDKVKVRLVDTALPFRAQGQAGAPPYHDNVGIVDMRPSTRVTGKGMPVTFTVTVANFSPRDQEVLVTIFDDETGNERFDVTFNERMPLRVTAGETATCSFELKFFPEIKENEPYFASISARLENPDRSPLANDGLPEDNTRHVAVEIRNKVPVLVVDGRGADGRKDGGDSYFLEHALNSIVGNSYQVVHADKLTGGDPVAALDTPDLSQYPTILLLNVPSLTPKQIANLEKYVRQGGGVGFFMGPLVDAPHYNQHLYRDGRGVFPVPLEDKYFPPKGKSELEASFTGRPQMLLRDDQFTGKGEQIPIYGAIFKEPKLRDFLKHLPVKRYWPALPRYAWKSAPGQVREVANLPNEAPVANTELANDAVAIADGLPVDQQEYRKFQASLEMHRKKIMDALRSPKTQAYQLAEIINDMLTDRGNGQELANLATDFWARSADPSIPTLAKAAESLRRRLLYSHPLVITSSFGQGRVVAVLTTAGKEWNDWAGGITGSVLYAPIVWEMQNWLSSQSGDAGLTVGTPLTLAVDRKRFNNKALKVSRVFYKTEHGKQAMLVPLEKDQFRDADASPDAKDGAKVEARGNGQPVKGDGKVEAKGDGKSGGDKETKGAVAEGLDTFTFPRSMEPGLYVTRLTYANPADGTGVLQTWGHVFNVDARHEGRLPRAAQEDLESSFLREAPADNQIAAPEAPDAARDTALVNRPRDLSELPWFFVLFLGILVAEQALAVHLSFHLRGSEAELPSQAVNPHASGKAA
ncbi:MAG: BatA domain-containing protein [Gemmataceae bacterium]|nr:BatA domain-containing protein [Gemmataceae bacterium]